MSEDPLWWSPNDFEICDVCKGKGRYYLISEAEEWNIDEVFEYWQSKVKP